MEKDQGVKGMAKVYAIRNRTSDDVYVGSTTKRYLSDRMSGHRYAYRQCLLGNNSRPCSSHKVLACPTAYIELLEECDVGVRKEREKFWIACFPTAVNKQTPTGTQRDYYLRNREHLIAYQVERKRRLKAEASSDK